MPQISKIFDSKNSSSFRRLDQIDIGFFFSVDKEHFISSKVMIDDTVWII